MKQWWMITGAGVALWVAAVAPASAQLGVYNRPQVSPRPTINPYLNLVGRGQPAVNYYGIVRPQLETAHALQMMQQEVQQLQPGLATPFSQSTQVEMLRTGHPVAFGNTSHYFPQPGARPGVGSMPTGYRNPSSPVSLSLITGLRR